MIIIELLTSFEGEEAMKIQSMFADDINRKINGVIKVDQIDDSTEREVKEYVITKELKKHFISFFNYYEEAIAEPTDDIGVWISGFFGSGKSHFLKMLSYILANNEISGKKTVEYFREKFSDDPATFMMIDNATKGKTETILFNIDIEGSINKDKTAVLRVFAKMFYNHLGFYGENLKVAMLEYYIEQSGKTEDFRGIFEEKKGKSWLEMRRAFAFNGKFIIPTLMEVLDMSEDDAKAWFADKSGVDISIAQLVTDINAYVSSKPKNFRLLFMIDEVGQYVGTDTDMLLNLQSLTEKIGTDCGGKVWVMCTGQEAIDQIIKVRSDEFSRIQARFKTRLSLSSSSVDEVIQKRILAKTLEAKQNLETLYGQNDSVLRNLFSFTDSILDIKGYTGASEFAVNFPFVPYQFIIMQKVFAEIRKHGNAGKHLSGGERSMLSGFQEAAQKLQERDEYALVPFFCFYDTVHSFLDGSIRRVMERCEKAAADGYGIEEQDINVLKLLYLLRYIDDIKSNIDNIVILMADDIRVDKITLRESVKNSLSRLISQNYIARTGDIYNFLTDEEQDIQREIKDTHVDTSTIIEKIANTIFADIYNTPKFRYGKYDFAFDRMVDSVTVGAFTGGMKLRFMTVAMDPTEKSELRLSAESKGSAFVVLADNEYYESIESAMKIRKYIKQKNVAQLAKSVQDIIKDQQDEATIYEVKATEQLRKAIEEAVFYADGEKIEIKGGDAKSKINQGLEYLVAHVYSELALITKNADTDADIIATLNGSADNGVMVGFEDNRDAAAKMEEYLEMQAIRKLPTSMADIQSRYQAIPYGWKEIDIAVVAARLVYEQKVTIKYAGTTIQPDDKKLPDMLRKKSEIGKVSIAKRELISVSKMKSIKEFLREYFDVMDIPEDEDSLISFVVRKFTEQKEHYETLNKRYVGKNYPDHSLVKHGVSLTEEVLTQQKDNISLIDIILKKQDDLFDNKDDMQNVESFFKNQVTIFDLAVKMENDLKNELDYLSREEEANKALNQIRLLTVINSSKFSYNKIPELNTLMQTVREGHERLLSVKREELLEIVRQCMEATHQGNMNIEAVKTVMTKADSFYAEKKARIAELTSLALLDGLVPPMLTYKDDVCNKIEFLQKPPAPKPVPTPVTTGTSAPKQVIRAFNRQVVFPSKRLENEQDVDAYVESMRDRLKELLKNCDGIQLN
ncbi:MAG: BREX system P-loop protein BrxC [Paludibacter sp.]|nr:BREX system P-loop protein BrxC [Paludibacter sp.]